MAEKFNVSGDGGRACPVCFRAGSLTGARDGDRPRLVCSGCYARFDLIWSDGILPDTLERVPAALRERPTSFVLTPGGSR